MLQFALFMASPYGLRRGLSLGGLVVLAIVDLVLQIYPGFILRGMLAGGVALMTGHRRSPLGIASGTVIAWTAVAGYLIGVACKVCSVISAAM
jgi:hypothetical protein